MPRAQVSLAALSLLHHRRLYLSSAHAGCFWLLESGVSGVLLYCSLVHLILVRNSAVHTRIVQYIRVYLQLCTKNRTLYKLVSLNLWKFIILVCHHRSYEYYTNYMVKLTIQYRSIFYLTNGHHAHQRCV